MPTLEQAAKAWIDLGRVLYPSLAEVEASLAAVRSPADARHRSLTVPETTNHHEGQSIAGWPSPCPKEGRMTDTRVRAPSPPTTITESTATAQPQQGGRMLVQLITPGDGSSGVYAPEVLEAAAAAGVFGAGTLMFADHPGMTESQDRPERSIRDVAGVLTENARWDGTALVAEARTYEPWASVLSQMHDAIGVSIRASARVEESDDRGRPVIAELVEGISVDFVTYPGRGGAIREVYESARPSVQVVETAPTIPPSSLAGVAMESHQKEEEPLMAQIQIDEAEHKRLTEASEKLATIEAERDTARQELEEARKIAIEARQSAEAATVSRILSEAGVQFSKWERAGIESALPRTEDEALDEAAFTERVKEAATEKAAESGHGRPTGFGSVNESTTDISEADLDGLLGITQKGA